MYILAIDTTGPVGSAALLDMESGAVISRETDENRAHLKNLAPMIREVTEEAGIEKKQIGFVAASVGPGSYTGIRIGVSTARAVAQALDVPCVRAGTLDLFRQNCGEGQPAAVIFNARRGQVYGAVFGEDGEDILAPGPYMLEDVTAAADRAGIDPVFYGDGIDAYAGHEKYGEYLKGRRFADKEKRYQNAAMTARAAAGMIRRGETCTVNGLLPDYMRKTEAEQRLEDGSLARARERKMARFIENK